ncbi:DUF4435 domain-containing protein [Pseudomonas sp. 39167]|uniref:DUF4435 domain-containing protein n=1 Tax=Pseudomonas sp. 39167 TaxID=2967215 RepID=UPI0023642F5A|nr:DUF4435 domain-containing protein [Pseudomonas sp. 39167]MDD2034506.1 DUF4435 domain-containing protein [Pseudomonas sp. 39167]
MADFDYSDDALNVIGAFYSAERMLYVEGDDDVVFWEYMLGKFGRREFKVQSTDGVKELNKYIKKIAANEINSSAARDADFTEIVGVNCYSPRVARTYGHSIENTIISAAVICKIIRSHGRVPGRLVDEEHCENWLMGFYRDFEDLVIYDAANEVAGLGISVLGMNCTKYMKGKLSCIPDEAKISGKLQELNERKELVEKAETVRKAIARSARECCHFIRGHFLSSAALKYVNNTIKRAGSAKNASADAFFSSAVIAFETVFDDDHPELDHYRSNILSL